MPVVLLPADLDRLTKLQELCYALGWTPPQWYQSTYFEASRVEHGYERLRRDRLSEASMLVCWLSGEMRKAYHAKQYQSPKPTDLYNPGIEERAKSREVQEDRRQTLDRFPKTLEPK